MFDWMGFWMVMGLIGGIMALVVGAIGAAIQYVKDRHEDQ